LVFRGEGGEVGLGAGAEGVGDEVGDLGQGGEAESEALGAGRRVVKTAA